MTGLKEANPSFLFCFYNTLIIHVIESSELQKLIIISLLNFVVLIMVVDFMN